MELDTVQFPFVTLNQQIPKTTNDDHFYFLLMNGIWLQRITYLPRIILLVTRIPLAIAALGPYLLIQQNAGKIVVHLVGGRDEDNLKQYTTTCR